MHGLELNKMHAHFRGEEGVRIVSRAVCKGNATKAMRLKV